MRSVVITGVSRGLGAALFDEFYASGDRILAVGRRFTETQQGLAATEPERVLLRRCDFGDPLSQPDAVELAEFVRGHSGHAVLVLNAGVVTPIGAVGEVPPADLARAAAVNLAAPMVLTNAFLDAATAAGRRSVLFISSGAARRVVGGWAAYCATKAGAEMFFAALAEQEGQRTHVVSVNPGVMDTDMQAEIRESTGYFPDLQRYRDRYADGELAGPAEVARRIIEENLPPD